MAWFEFVGLALLALCVTPLLIFGIALLGDHIRHKRGLAPLPPDCVSHVVIFCILYVWLMICITLVLGFLRS